MEENVLPIISTVSYKKTEILNSNKKRTKKIKNIYI
jgi:hypothetical protein